MNLFFLLSSKETQLRFLNPFEAWLRKFSPNHFTFTFDPEGKHAIHHYRLKWQGDTSSGVDLRLSVIHVAEVLHPFHRMLEMDADGVFYVSDVHMTELNMDVERMRMVMPPGLFKRPQLEEGCVYFREDLEAISDEALQEVSQKLGIPLFVEGPEKIPALCSHIISKLCETQLNKSIAETQ